MGIVPVVVGTVRIEDLGSMGFQAENLAVLGMPVAAVVVVAVVVAAVVVLVMVVGLAVGTPVVKKYFFYL